MKLLLFLLVTLLLSGCFSNEEHEVSRITSPDGVVDAVLTEVETNAITPTANRIYIVMKGSETVDQEPIFSADHLGLQKIFWSDKKLVIQFFKGRIFYYRNFWQSNNFDNSEYKVEVLLYDTNTPAYLEN